MLSFVLLIGIAVLVFLAIRSIRKNGSGCCGDCNRCSGGCGRRRVPVRKDS